MSQTTERNLVIGGVVALLLFLLLRRTASLTSAVPVIPPLPQDTEIFTHTPDGFPEFHLTPPNVPSLEFTVPPQGAPMVHISKPNLNESMFVPATVDYPLLSLNRPSFLDEKLPEIGGPSSATLFDTDGIGSQATMNNGEFLLIGTVPGCEC